MVTLKLKSPLSAGSSASPVVLISPDQRLKSPPQPCQSQPASAQSVTPHVLKRQQAQKHGAMIKAVQQWLSQQWPALFDLQNPKPLKINIAHDIYPALEPPLSKTQVRSALKAYTQRTAYLQALIQQDWRYDLQGQPIEPIEQAHKDYAGQQLELKQQYFARRQQQYHQRHQQRQASSLSPERVHKAGDKQPDHQVKTLPQTEKITSPTPKQAVA